VLRDDELITSPAADFPGPSPMAEAEAIAEAIKSVRTIFHNFFRESFFFIMRKEHLYNGTDGYNHNYQSDRGWFSGYPRVFTQSGISRDVMIRVI
jgi:hypothetical protein